MGRYVIIKFRIKDEIFLLTNIYAPNQDKPKYFDKVCSKMCSMSVSNHIVGGDFNLVLDTEIDSKSRKTNNHKSVKVLKEYMENENVVDIFRCKFPSQKCYMHF